MQERGNFIANALQLRPFCINPLICLFLFQPATPHKSFPVSPTEDTASPNEDFWKAYDKSPVARKIYQPSEAEDSENMSSSLSKTAKNSQHSESGNSTSSEIVNKNKISKSATNRSNVICDDSPGQKGAVIHSPAIKRLKEGNLNMTFDPPTDMETDCSMLCDDSFLFSAENEPTMDDDKRDKEVGTGLVLINSFLKDCGISSACSGIILCMIPANERRLYSLTPSLIGWAHTWSDPWSVLTHWRYSSRALCHRHGCLKYLLWDLEIIWSGKTWHYVLHCNNKRVA